VEKRLQNSKIKTHQKGRETLPKNTLSKILTYYVFNVPINIAEKLKRLERNFLWNSKG